ncbi:hypothetical protein [Microvirga tunisiensis]|uniref:Uncharacterized protein n=1 Tax=Microvirga tunisiensis TaxID=2108360 RepID=A0A5N7MH17_9HYPH|nr:hypothetical protein [Microvirga tunisiensis]MPR07802.1 hypothetical protein [Microvirga tunisiensis]MPR26197.1 hypothetical protein [Microvirga tunisiensis]
MSADQIKDSTWREELNERFGWMGGRHGLSFECGGGWRFLLDDLLQRMAATLSDEERQDFQVTQIKEKLGTLRCHVFNGNDRVDALIDSAENASEITCDVCGGRGRLRNSGWLTVRCDEHVDYRG